MHKFRIGNNFNVFFILFKSKENSKKKNVNIKLKKAVSLFSGFIFFFNPGF